MTEIEIMLVLCPLCYITLKVPQDRGILPYCPLIDEPNNASLIKFVGINSEKIVIKIEVIKKIFIDNNADELVVEFNNTPSKFGCGLSSFKELAVTKEEIIIELNGE